MTEKLLNNVNNSYECAPVSLQSCGGWKVIDCPSSWFTLRSFCNQTEKSYSVVRPHMTLSFNPQAILQYAPSKGIKAIERT